MIFLAVSRSVFLADPFLAQSFATVAAISGKHYATKKGNEKNM